MTGPAGEHEAVMVLDTASIIPAVRRSRIPSHLVLNTIVMVLACITAAFLALPLAGLLSQLTASHFVSVLGSSVVLSALKLSLITSGVSAVIVAVSGGALAYVLARTKLPGKAVIDTIIDLPMILPPMVAGLMLLLIFGRQGWIGVWLNLFGITITFTAVAVVLAQVFVSLPFFVRTARAAFESIDPRLETASLLLGASRLRTFCRVTLPVAAPTLSAGIVLAWARSLGEFGATIVFAGNFRGTTQTMPLAIFEALQSDIQVAVSVSLVLLFTSFALVLALKWLVGSHGGAHA
jgi:molybdate transport system permease protein